MRHILQIVPRLPPAINGLGDYGFNLAKQLRYDFRIETHFLIGDSNWTGARHIEGFPIRQVTKPSAADLASRLASDSSTVLLHYVGYGYARRGCPVWLVEGLEHWKRNTPNSRLITMFHEIYASGPPWTSAFWLSEQQKNLAARLVKLSDRCCTSLQRQVQLLSRLSSNPHSSIHSLPVFSNVGEVKTVPSLLQRKRRLVIFGTYGRRLPIYRKSQDALTRLVQELEIEEILDIGKPLSPEPTQVGSVPVISFGEQSASVVSNFLLDAIAGVIDYSATNLAKSGIFAAYCAHGLLPIVVGTNKISDVVDGLTANKHYWLPNWHYETLSLVIAQKIATNAYLWYQNHNLSVHAKTLVAQLAECCK